MRKILCSLVALPAALLAGCGFAGDFQGIRGSGTVVSETRPVAGFNTVSFRGSGQLTIDHGDTESLVITTDDNLLPYLISEVTGNQLVLGTKEHTNVNPSKDVVYKLTVKDLNAIEVAGSGDAAVKGIHTNRLKAVVAGSGSLSTAGAAEQQEIMIAGSGNYSGDALKSKNVTISIMGSGNAELAASDKLDVTIMGSGDIKYAGDPAVTQHIMGSGSVQKR